MSKLSIPKDCHSYLMHLPMNVRRIYCLQRLTDPNCLHKPPGLQKMYYPRDISDYLALELHIPILLLLVGDLPDLSRSFEPQSKLHCREVDYHLGSPNNLLNRIVYW